MAVQDADFAARREPELGDMSRLYAIESRFSTTGVVSDHRLPVKSSDAGAILQLIEAGLGMGTPGARAAALGDWMLRSTGCDIAGGQYLQRERNNTGGTGKNKPRAGLQRLARGQLQTQH